MLMERRVKPTDNADLLSGSNVTNLCNDSHFTTMAFVPTEPSVGMWPGWVWSALSFYWSVIWFNYLWILTERMWWHRPIPCRWDKHQVKPNSVLNVSPALIYLTIFILCGNYHASIRKISKRVSPHLVCLWRAGTTVFFWFQARVWSWLSYGIISCLLVSLTQCRIAWEVSHKRDSVGQIDQWAGL